MPATLPHGPSIPITVPPIDPRTQRRPIPSELRPFDRDESILGKAIRRLSREIFHPDHGLAEREEQFKRRVADAVNELAMAAFTPRTTISYLDRDTTIDSDVWADLPAMPQTIVVPIPARIHMILNIVVNVEVPDDEFLELRVSGGSTDMCFSRVRQPVAGVALFQWNITAQDVFNAEPEVLYVFAPQARVSVAGPEYLAICGDSLTTSTFTVRVEPRSLLEE